MSASAAITQGPRTPPQDQNTIVRQSATAKPIDETLRGIGTRTLAVCNHPNLDQTCSMIQPGTLLQQQLTLKKLHLELDTFTDLYEQLSEIEQKHAYIIQLLQEINKKLRST